MALLGLIAATLAQGCAGSGARSEAWENEALSEVAGGSELLVSADWDDIDAAVDVGVSQVEMAVVSRNAGPGWGGRGGDPVRRLFELKTVRDEPAWLEVSRGTSGDAVSRVALRAKVGRFGDKKREGALLRAVGQRLEVLHGKDWYPLDP